MSHPEFNELLLTNADFLKPFAINLTRDSEAANDLYQETLYKALANRGKIQCGYEYPCLVIHHHAKYFYQ